ncbi:MAG: hypothetical protein R6U84_03590 [Candidatus Cloacimonadales bacterium]
MAESEQTFLFSKFQKTEPADFSELDLATDCKITYDQKNLYLRWEVEIDENFKAGNFTSRERQPEADYLALELITQNSDFAYGFMFFPLENKIDYVRDQNMATNISWDSRYQYSSQLSENLWIVQAVIPVNNLRFAPEPPHRWKIVLSRFLKQQEATYSAPAISTKMGKDYFRQASEIVIEEKFSRNLNLFLRPYYVGVVNLQNTEDYDSKYGCDFSIDPSASSKLKFTINPDFSDIPLDNATDIYNLKYPFALTENRYFFVEDINAFNTTKELFYSRRIMQPQYAVKINGNWDNFSFGLLSSRDKKITTYDDYYQQNITTNHDYFYNILAFKPSTENFSTEITLLNRMKDDYHNEVLHLKPHWEFAPGNTLWLESNFSYKDQNDANKQGNLSEFGYRYDSNLTSIEIILDRISPDYSADMGYIYETNVSNFNLEISRRLSLNKFKLRKLYTTAVFNNQTELDSQKNINRYAGFSATSSTDFNIALNLDFTLKDELYNDTFHQQYIYTAGAIWYNYKWFRPDFRLSKMEALVYELDATYEALWAQFAISSDLNKFSSFRLTSDHIQYQDLPNLPGLDEDYWLINFDADLAFSAKLAISTGLRLDTYNNEDKYGIFANLQWQLRDFYSLIIGYKSTPTHSADSANRQTIFIKNSLEF